MKGEKYTCVYVSGSGTNYSEGQWEIKTLTKKTLIIKKISEATVHSNYEKSDEIRCGRLKSNGNPLRDWEDETFTIYPEQNGTPYYFEPIV